MRYEFWMWAENSWVWRKLDSSPGWRLQIRICIFHQKASRLCPSQTRLQNTGLYFVTSCVALISWMAGNSQHVCTLQWDYCLKESFICLDMLQNPPGFWGKPVFVSISALNDHHNSRKLPDEVVLESCVLQKSTLRCSLSLPSFNGAILGPGTPAHQPRISELNHSLTRLFSIKLFCL